MTSHSVPALLHQTEAFAHRPWFNNIHTLHSAITIRKAASTFLSSILLLLSSCLSAISSGNFKITILLLQSRVAQENDPAENVTSLHASYFVKPGTRTNYTRTFTCFFTTAVMQKYTNSLRHR
jgi:hypothetical protein